MDEQGKCRRCGHEMRAEEAYCAACGLARSDLWDDMAGFVADGRWWRPGSEFVRRIDLEEMRQGLLRASVLVPNGSIGVVSVDGEVEEILRPGKRTTVTWLDRLQDLFTDKLDRTSFYLVDLRPIPIPIRFEAPVQGKDSAVEETVEATATILASVDRSDRTSLGTFIQAVVRERGTLDQKDLHLLLTGQAAQRARQMVISGLRDDPSDFVGVARRVAAELNEEVGSRLGLHLDLLIDLNTVRSLDLRLGLGKAPTARTCTHLNCGHELPSSASFCPACGTRQPLSARRCGQCDTVLATDQGFCSSCGERWTEPPAAERPLFTADGEAVELDLVLRVRGLTGEDLTQRVSFAAATLVGAALRRRSFSELASEEGFTDLARALHQSLEENLQSVGVEVREVAVLDLRSKGGEWLLDARADLDRQRQQILMDRQWLEVEGESLDLEELAQSVVLRRRQMELAERFQTRNAELDAESRQQDLDDRATELTIRAAEREARSAIGREDAARSRSRHQREEDHKDAQADERASQELADQRLEHEILQNQKLREEAAESARQEMAISSERSRRSADDQLYGERGRRDLDHETETKQQDLQLEKLRRMAELDQQIASGDHRREMERRAAEAAHQQELAASGLSESELLAVQATELASQEHGDAAFAALEGARVAEAQKEATDALLKQAQDARQEMKELMQEMATLQQRTMEAALGAQATAHAESSSAYREASRQASSMTERSLEALGDVQASGAAPAPVVAAVGAASSTDCKECGQDLAPPYRFCGRCGIEQ